MLDEEKIEEIIELAGCFFSKEEIMEIMEIKHPTEQLDKAIRTGYLKSEAQLRKSILDLAKQGSSPAQTIAVKLLAEIKRNE